MEKARILGPSCALLAWLLLAGFCCAAAGGFSCTAICRAVAALASTALLIIAVRIRIAFGRLCCTVSIGVSAASGATIGAATVVAARIAAAVRAAVVTALNALAILPATRRKRLLRTFTNVVLRRRVRDVSQYIIHFSQCRKSYAIYLSIGSGRAKGLPLAPPLLALPVVRADYAGKGLRLLVVG